MTDCDILVSGTGSFAARIVFDIAATAGSPIAVTIAGRNQERLNWLVTAANARAVIFGTQARFNAFAIDLLQEGASDELVATTWPKVVVQAASVQTSAVIAQSGNAWTRLVAEGGLSATAVFQAIISHKVAAAMQAAGSKAALINCCFPDVVNGMLTALGHKVLCGMGNVAILSNVFAGSGIVAPGRDLKVLAHYQNLAAFRQPASQRQGISARVWLDGEEVEDVFRLFAKVKLTPEPVIDISGASGVPLMLALAAGKPWRGHVPGPNGLPGGYPALVEEGRMVLDLPEGLSEKAAIAWNRSFEERSGLILEGTRVIYTGQLFEKLRAHDAGLAGGFDISQIIPVYEAMSDLRQHLSNRA